MARKFDGSALGWGLVVMGILSSVIKALGYKEVGEGIDAMLGDLQPLLIGSGAAVLQQSDPLKRIKDDA